MSVQRSSIVPVIVNHSHLFSEFLQTLYYIHIDHGKMMLPYRHTNIANGMCSANTLSTGLVLGRAL